MSRKSRSKRVVYLWFDVAQLESLNLAEGPWMAKNGCVLLLAQLLEFGGKGKNVVNLRAYALAFAGRL